jgi:SPP1 gp7 family putative phage head morphogenesis protein
MNCGAPKEGNNMCELCKDEHLYDVTHDKPVIHETIPLLTEEEFEIHLNELTESADDNITNFFEKETIDLMKKLVKYENEKTKEVFDNFKRAQRQLLFTIEDSDDAKALWNMIDGADTPQQLLNVYKSQRYLYLVERLKIDLEEINKSLKKSISKYMSESFSRSYLGGGHMLSQALPKAAISFGGVPVEQVNALIDMPYFGQSLYERIDDLTNSTLNKIKSELVQGMIDGRSMDEIAKRVSKVIGKDIKRAMLITRTEIMRASNTGLMELYKRNDDALQGVTYLATLDLRTCSVCGSFDGNVYKWGEPRPSLPIHPRCRCTYAPRTISIDELNDKFDLNIDSLPIPMDQRPDWTDWMSTQIKQGALDNRSLIRKIFSNKGNYEKFISKFV